MTMPPGGELLAQELIALEGADSHQHAGKGGDIAQLA